MSPGNTCEESPRATGRTSWRAPEHRLLCAVLTRVCWSRQTASLRSIERFFHQLGTCWIVVPSPRLGISSATRKGTLSSQRDSRSGSIPRRRSSVQAVRVDHASPWLEGYLLRNFPWTEYVLYFTFLEATGLFDKYHFVETFILPLIPLMTVPRNASTTRDPRGGRGSTARSPGAEGLA